MNLFEKQQKRFAIKLSERVKEEIKKTSGSDWYDDKPNQLLFHYPNFHDYIGFMIGRHTTDIVKKNYTLITEAEFFGDGNNKLREKFEKEVDSIFYENDNFLSKKLEMTIEKAEQIADDFSVKFFDWANVNAYKYPTKTTTIELLQIFKTL